MKMKFKPMDIILVSYAKNKKLKKITDEAIRSIDPKHNIIIIESNPSASYPGTTTVYPNVSFNYNKFLNIGARRGGQEYIFFGNNDLIFTKNWDEEIQQKMEEFSLLSASPFCPETDQKFGIDKNSGVRFGCEVHKYFCGWAYIWKRSLYERLGGLDETFNFWCSDNVVIDQLRKANIQHALIPSSIVHHIKNGGNTLKSLSLSKMKSYTLDEIQRYNDLYHTDIKIGYYWGIPEILREALFTGKGE
jgi:hypothetical protein